MSVKKVLISTKLKEIKRATFGEEANLASVVTANISNTSVSKAIANLRNLNITTSDAAFMGISKMHPSHSYTDSVKKAATCTDLGRMLHTCSECQYAYETNIEALGHNWNSGVITKAATCGADGVKTFTCSRCNNTRTETINKTNNHTFTSWVTTKDPTTTSEDR